MATYRNIASTETDADSPVTVQLMDALRQNPEAIAEGASGAPQVQPAALNVFNAQANGALTAGSSVVILTATNLTDINRAMITGYVVATPSGGSGQCSTTYQLSTDGGSTWGSAATASSIYVASADGQSYLPVCFVVDVSGSTDAIRISGVLPASFNGSANYTLLQVD
jgi:hypothetical protein